MHTGNTFRPRQGFPSRAPAVESYIPAAEALPGQVALPQVRQYHNMRLRFPSPQQESRIAYNLGNLLLYSSSISPEQRDGMISGGDYAGVQHRVHVSSPSC